MPSIHSSPILLPMPFNPTIIYQLCAPVSHNFVNCCGAGASGAQKTGRVLEICARRGRSHWTDEVAPAGVLMKSLRLWRMRRSFLRLSAPAGLCILRPPRRGCLSALAGLCILLPPRRDVCPRWRGSRSAASTQCGGGLSYDGELCAGEMLVPAGFSPGTGVCARGGGEENSECGGWARLALRFWRGGCPRFARGLTVLSLRFASVCARPCDSIAAFCLSLCPGLRLWLGCCHRFARSGLRFWRSGLPRFTPGLAVLAPTFCLSLRPALRF